MKFRIENVGKVQFAEIELNGLTVLTGENSIGKSAIGKAIFSLVKSRNGVLDRLEGDIPLEIATILSDISLIVTDDKKNLQGGLNSASLAFIKPLFDSDSNSIPFLGKKILLSHFLEFKKGVINLIKYKEDKNIQEIVKGYFEKIQQILNEFTNEDFFLKENFNHLIQHNFYNELNNKLATKKTASLEFFFKKKLSISIEVENNETTSFNAGLFMPLQDVTMIESPIIATLFSFIRDSMAFGRGRNQSLNYKGLPFYIFDLMEKLSRANGITAKKEIFESIGEVIGGKVAFDHLGNNFSFTDQSANSYSILNTASGIKTFGLLQLLLSANCLNKQSLLIIDEPEVHLHPLWQLEYAKILVQLAKAGVPILLASHSPYFIEALKVYSDKEIPEKTKFYFGEMQEKGSVFKDVTSDLEPIFDLLAIPMQKLIIEK